MSQTSYSMGFVKAIAGMIYDASGSPKKIDSYTTPTDTIPFGRFVAKVSGDDDGCKLPSSSGDQIIGIAIRSDSQDTVDYLPLDKVPVMKTGKVWCLAEENVTADDPVFVRYATGGGGSLKGIVRNDADTSTALAVTNAKFFSNALAGEFVVVEINIP